MIKKAFPLNLFIMQVKIMVRKICREFTGLTEKDIDKIVSISEMLPYFCELANADIFIDCFSPDGEKGIVVAHGKPQDNSQYRNNIQGEAVMPENEPIVFYTKKTGRTIQDAKGFTQEKKWVLQKTLPVYNDEKEIIAVLVEERDVKYKMKTDKKLEQVKQKTAEIESDVSRFEKADDVVEKEVVIQEMHHRIKNNLQVISSILSMQERRSSSEETRNMLKDNINRINNIAQLHETFMNSGENSININMQLRLMASNLMSYATGEGKMLYIYVAGDPVSVDSKKAMAILMVVNELVTNSIRHGYGEKSSGRIHIDVIAGPVYSSIIVTDDGKGFAADGYADEKKNGIGGGLGSEIIRMMVYDDLKGNFHIESGAEGTCAHFDFMM